MIEDKTITSKRARTKRMRINEFEMITQYSLKHNNKRMRILISVQKYGNRSMGAIQYGNHSICEGTTWNEQMLAKE